MAKFHRIKSLRVDISDNVLSTAVLCKVNLGSDLNLNAAVESPAAMPLANQKLASCHVVMQTATVASIVAFAGKFEGEESRQTICENNF